MNRTPYTTIDLHLVHPSGVPRSTYLRQLLRETKIRRSIFSPPHHAAPAACCGLVLLRRSQSSPFSKTRRPRWILTLAGGILGFVGLFCLIYLSAFLFSEYDRSFRGILCMTVGFLIFAIALFLI